jgi:rhodanese-related sulfurtransferase
MKIKSYMKDGIPTLNPQDVPGLVGIQIIDVRTPEEYTGELGHIENARLVTLGPELETFLSLNDKNKPLIFVCRSGTRSGKATIAAMEVGFSEVYNLDGGMMKWNSLNMPTKRL